MCIDLCATVADQIRGVGGRMTYLWKACNLTAVIHSSAVPLVQWSTHLLPVMRDLGSIPRGYLCETGILLLVLSRYIGDPDVINHCGLI